MTPRHGPGHALPEALASQGPTPGVGLMHPVGGTDQEKLQCNSKLKDGT